MRIVARFALLLVAVSSLSCAAGMTAVPNPMPAARSGLAPQYRIFYDALKDYGDWTLIEPYGYVFHPNVSFIGWSPYDYGFWVPNDTFGWVWISSEPFGWATYHYGSWMRDRYEGWVWIPGLDWGPAWVDWQMAGDYVGWAPAQLRGSTASPADVWHYVPISQLGSTNLAGNMLTHAEVEPRVESFTPVLNLAKINGVTVNRGPALDLVQRKAGPLTRVRIAEIQAAAPGASPAPAGEGAPAATPLAEAERRAAEAAQQARQMVETGAPPPREISIVRVPEPKRAPGEEPRVPAGRPAPADTTRR